MEKCGILITLQQGKYFPTEPTKLHCHGILAARNGQKTYSREVPFTLFTTIIISPFCLEEEGDARVVSSAVVTICSVI